LATVLAHLLSASDAPRSPHTGHRTLVSCARASSMASWS
jgi:hypothetical protein